MRLRLIDADARLHSQMQEQSVQALEDKLHEAETTEEGNVCRYAGGIWKHERHVSLRLNSYNKKRL